MKYLITIFTGLCLLSPTATWADAASQLLVDVDRRGERFDDLAMRLWQEAELGYLETISSTALQSELSAEGFEVTPGVAGIPTAFVATYGEGEPVIALLAEFDALPGISQSASPVREKRIDKTSGHAAVQLAACLHVVQRAGSRGTSRQAGDGERDHAHDRGQPVPRRRRPSGGSGAPDDRSRPRFHGRGRRRRHRGVTVCAAVSVVGRRRRGRAGCAAHSRDHPCRRVGRTARSAAPGVARGRPRAPA